MTHQQVIVKHLTALANAKGIASEEEAKKMACDMLKELGATGATYKDLYEAFHRVEYCMQMASKELGHNAKHQLVDTNGKFVFTLKEGCCQ